MTKNVLLSIVATQDIGEERETTKLLTEGTLRREGGALLLSYKETELTGLAGTTTTFRIEGDCVVLSRTGALQSEMLFREGTEDRSLYDMGFGALMVTVCARRIENKMTENGGTLDVAYSIIVEDEAAGEMEYQIEVREK